jgi:maltooligosyltrehalose trehalohydrolase
MTIGAEYIGRGRCRFSVWGPFLKGLSVKVEGPLRHFIAMEKDGAGYWNADVENVYPGILYRYRLEDELDRPDPASHFQPEGVHGPSQVVDHSAFMWNEGNWKGIPLQDMIMYELHVGTFSPGGTFDDVVSRLDDLLDLGVNAIELMPVAQFPGERNWGYDGVYPFAVQNSYGGPDGLKRLVNVCHLKGIAVILDVVYNHLGPEGNYLGNFGPYFTDKYRTPWGQAMNFDGPYSNEVRAYFIENALTWFHNYHIDALRLDAIHGISDMSAKPFLQELAERVDALSAERERKLYLIAESDLNDSRVIKPRELGGYGFDAQWCDDFHHALHTLLTGENTGYYCDFGSVGDLAKSLRGGFVYTGQYSCYRKRNHGNSSKDRPAAQFVVFSQNHDQVGNRMLGERLSSLASFEALKLAAGNVLLSPYIPLLFMGEEHGEDAPFLYFVSHFDKDLIDAVRKGRKEEFRTFAWQGDPPDPQGLETFIRSKIHWEKRDVGNHKVLLDFYKRLINLRKEINTLAEFSKDSFAVHGLEDEKIVFIHRWYEYKDICIFAAFNFDKQDRKTMTELSEGTWKIILDSADQLWRGLGSYLPETLHSGAEIILRGESFAVYIKEVGS